MSATSTSSASSPAASSESNDQAARQGPRQGRRHRTASQRGHAKDIPATMTVIGWLNHRGSARSRPAPDCRRQPKSVAGDTDLFAHRYQTRARDPCSRAGASGVRSA